MAAVCHQFVQNAWKKDLCSNCFKCKEEHNGGTACKPRYLATMYPSRAHSWRAPQGILKDTHHQLRRPKGSAVHFPTEESQVIGFGGGECYSSDGEDTADQDESTTGSDIEEGEEERALQKLTRTNTDYNSNLSHSGLELGKPLTDSEGKRKTLLVSVTPFEKKSFNVPYQDSKDVILKSLVKHNDFGNTPNSKRDSKENKESVKQNDIISNKNDSEKCKVKTHKSIKENIESDLPAVSISDRNETEKEKSLKEIQINSPVCSVSKQDEEKHKSTPSKVAADINSLNSALNQGIAEKYKDPLIRSLKKPDLGVTLSSVSAKACTEKFKDLSFKSAKKSEFSPSLGLFKNRNILEKSKDISLIPSKLNESILSSDTTLKAKSDGEKKSNIEKSAKEIEQNLSRTSVSNVNKLDISKDISPRVLKQEGSNISTGSSADKTIETKPGECESTKLINKCSVENDKISRIPVIKTRPKPAARKSYDLIKRNDIAVKKVAEIKQITEIASFQESKQAHEISILQEVQQSVESFSQEVSQTVESDSQGSKGAHENISQIENFKEEGVVNNEIKISAQEEKEEDVNCKDESEINKDKIVCPPDEISTKECDHMFSMEESRELAGEPDGRADPDEPGEPPALPQSPPPVVDPRPSFLHGLVQVKPKIPAKPTARLLQATPRRIILPREEIETPETESARTQKRQAPKPPPTPVEEISSSPLPLIPPVGEDTVVTKEPVLPCDIENEVSTPQCPEPVPRKILTTPESDKKKTSTGKAKFSLKKFLRLGGSKEDKTGDQVVVEELPVPRPRLEIIHPSELNGSNVEVVGRSADENDSPPGILSFH